MRVLLVNPDSAAQGGYSNPPLGLAYLAGTLESNGIPVSIVDGYIAGKGGVARALDRDRPDIVGITCYTPGRGRVLDIARQVKNQSPGTIVVLGGAHPTIMWKQIIENYPQVDACVLGEGEQTLLEIAQGKPLPDVDGIAWRDGSQARKNPKREYAKNIDDIPFPAWHLLSLRDYPARGAGTHNGIDLSKEPRVTVIFSRGCIGQCSFCSTWWIWRGYRHRSPCNMVDEMQLLHDGFGIRHFVFGDDALSVDIEAAKELCREIPRRGLKIAFHATTRADSVDEELLHLMREAGCYEIAYGVESGSEQVLKTMRKDIPVEQSRNALRLTKQAGIRACALVIVGSEGETAGTINETVGFLNETNPDHVGHVGGLWVLPGTTLYQRAKRKGLIDDSFWLGPHPYMTYAAGHGRLRQSKFLAAVLYRAKLGTSAFRVAYAKHLLRRAASRPYRIARALLRMKL